MKFARSILGVTLVSAALVTGAQQPPPAGNTEEANDAPLQTVKISGVRDPAMMPYNKAYEMLTKLQKVGAGGMEMAIRVVSAKTMQPIPDLEISLQGDSNFEKLALSPEGFLSVPLSKERLADKAVFVTNKKAGTVKAEYFFVPTMPKERLYYSDIANSIAAARRARAAVVPWYMRAIVPAVQEVRICYPNSNQEVSIFNGTTVTRPATLTQKSMLTKETVYCAAFNSRETEAAKDSLVTLPPGWTALFN
jgi:hypothetical protein